MSVRGEYRRLGGALLEVLREEAGAGREAPHAAALACELERAAVDLSSAAEATLALLPRLAEDAPSDTAARRRFGDAYERLEAICRIILGRPA